MNRRWRLQTDINGYSIPELVVAIVILVALSVAVLGTYSVMVGSAGLARMKSAGLGLATEQLEYIRSLPYDSLAVEGGSINTSGPTIPASKQQQSGTYTFVISTNIQYADDAYDGCLNYPPSQSYLCRNGPAKSGLPVDSNPKDYKLVDIVVREKNTNREVSRVSTQVAARVAETGSNTGAVLVTITDSTGQPVAGATVRVANSNISPAFNQTSITDTNGVALFLDVTPDSGENFIVSASLSGYSTLSTIASSGSLIPTYPNVSVLAQQVTSSTLKIDKLATDSLALNIVDTSGSSIPNSTFSIKGGIKLYIDEADQSYSFEQASVSADTNGQYVFHNLVPGPYLVCFNGDLCSSGNYLSVTQVAYGSNSLQPIIVPAGTVSESGSGPMQAATLVISNSSTTPRIRGIDPTSFSASGTDVATAQIAITGANLSGSLVSLRQGATLVPTTPVGTDSSTLITRQIDLSGKSGAWEVVLVKGSTTLVQNSIAPGTIGGVFVTP